MHSLQNQLLIPTEHNDQFDGQLLYLCRHNSDGAWGFIINEPLELAVGSLLLEMGLDGGESLMQRPVYYGGDDKSEMGFILHTGLPTFANSCALGENICLSTSKDVLDAIASGSLGAYLLLLGSCRFAKGELEQMIESGLWLTAPATSAVIFMQGGDELGSYDTPSLLHHDERITDKKLRHAHAQLNLNADALAVPIGRA